ncbi:MAG: DnaD domain-containing protein [Dehalococcoidia bacterium]
MTTSSRPFRGFAGGTHATVIPNTFFTEVVPSIDDPVELLVSTYVFYALARRRAGERWLTVEQLSAEMPLRRAMTRLTGRDAVGEVERGLQAAVTRGTLVAGGGDGPVRYAINSPAGRRMLALPATTEMDMVAPRDLDPPNIYALYEESIGTVSPLIADELRAAEEEYPPPWIEAAFREAAAQNRRSWRYVARILERWRDEGRNDATVGRDPGTRHDLAGRYRGLIRR